MTDTATTSRPPAAPSPPDAKPATLDDVMIAMDVVDTVRHRDDLVKRELNDTGREAELIERLKEIYHQQGIEVPDAALAEGVKALKESRFTYAPPPDGLKRRLLTLWVKRSSYGKVASVAIAALLGSCGIHYATVTRPVLVAEQQVRVELTETLPRAIRQAHADTLHAATDPAVKPEADALLASGERGIRDKDKAAMVQARDGLTALRENVTRAYTLTIVSRPGETTGVWRRPPKSGGRSDQARNYYLVVEPLGPDRRPIELPILNEETGKVETVAKFGVRVPQATFDAVSADKRDDGIIQNNAFGTKQRGTLKIDYAMPFVGGMITRW